MLEFDIQCYTLGSLTTGGVVVFYFFIGVAIARTLLL